MKKILLTTLVLVLSIVLMGSSVLASGGTIITGGGGGGGNTWTCMDGKDNDEDGDVDTADSDCDGFFSNAEREKETVTTTGGGAITEDELARRLRAIINKPRPVLELFSRGELDETIKGIKVTINELTAELIPEVVSAGLINERNLAISAVRQTLIRLVRHTINVVTYKIAVLAAQQ